MNKKSKDYHFIVTNRQSFNSFKSSESGAENARLYNYDQLDKLELSKQQLILLIPARQLFLGSIIIPVQARSKLAEIVKYRFIKGLPLPENDLYFSYYVDEELATDSLNLLCFAIKKTLLDDYYHLFIERGSRIKAILPLPLLYYIFHSRNDQAALEDLYRKAGAESGVSAQESNAPSPETSFSEKSQQEKQVSRKKQAFIYLDKISSCISFTVFYRQGVYLRSAQQNKINQEFKKIKNYLAEDLKVNKFKIDYLGNKLDSEELFPAEKEAGLARKITEKQKFMTVWQELREKDFKSINLLSYLPAEKKKEKKKYSFIIAVLLFLTILTGVFSLVTYFQSKEDEIAANKKQLQQVVPALNQLAEINGKLATTEQQLNRYNKLIEKKHSYLSWILELSEQLPADTRIRHLNFTAEKMLILDGSAPSAASVLAALQQSKMFRKLEYVGGIVVEKDRENFKIAGELTDD